MSNQISLSGSLKKYLKWNSQFEHFKSSIGTFVREQSALFFAGPVILDGPSQRRSQAL